MGKGRSHELIVFTSRLVLKYRENYMTIEKNFLNASKSYKLCVKSLWIVLAIAILTDNKHLVSIRTSVTTWTHYCVDFVFLQEFNVKIEYNLLFIC